MGTFDHIRKNLVPATEYTDKARWVPPNWDYGADPVAPALLLLAPRNSNRRWLKAVAHPRVPKAPVRRGGAIEPSDLVKSRERMAHLIAMGLACGWENVKAADGTLMPFPEIVPDPTHPGVRLVIEWITMFGEEAMDDLVLFVNNITNWVGDDSQPEGEEGESPLGSSSASG